VRIFVIQLQSFIFFGNDPIEHRFVGRGRIPQHQRGRPVTTIIDRRFSGPFSLERSDWDTHSGGFAAASGDCRDAPAAR
jgi:hypothetical protein